MESSANKTFEKFKSTMISVVRDKNKKILKELMLEMIDNYAEIEK